MRHAKVHVSIMGDETRQNLSLRGLQSAAGFLQSKIAKQIDTRYTPRLMFVLDQGVKKSIEMARLLREVLPPKVEDDDSLENRAAGASPRLKSTRIFPTSTMTKTRTTTSDESDEKRPNSPR